MVYLKLFLEFPILHITQPITYVWIGFRPNLSQFGQELNLRQLKNSLLSRATKAKLLSLKTRVSHFASTLFTAHIGWAAGRLGSKQVGCEVAYTRL